jgi:hypothetical protein
MTERSRPWDGTTVGDAVDAPYDAASEWADMFLALSPAASQSVNKGGVVFSAQGFGDLAATTPSANTARIATGIAWNQGTWYKNDGNVDITISTPAVSTRTDVIVLRKSWSGQTVRLAKVTGTEGAGAPSITQNYGVTWDIPLWNASITTAGVITFTDRRLPILLPVHTHTTSYDGTQISHSSLASVTANQHHLQIHGSEHRNGGADPVGHLTLPDVGTNTHVQIDTHITTNAGSPTGPHNMARFNTNGTQSLGAPTDGKIAFCRANGGALTMTTPSGSIFVGTFNDGSDTVIADGDALTLIADGTNWAVY